MNTHMYLHPLTAKQLKIVTEEIGYKVVGPQEGKKLACGDVGQFLVPLTNIGNRDIDSSGLVDDRQARVR